MNKNDFLKKLSKLLYMLKEEEVKDILSEYEQHIDMKVEEGMSEEDAIAAFGTVEELAAEILDAYHVKADFRKKNEVMEKVQLESKKAMKSAGEAGKGFGSKCVTSLKQAASAIVRGGKQAASAIKKFCLTPFVFLKNLFKKKETEPDMAVQEKKKPARSFGSLLLLFFKGAIRFIKRCCYGILLFITGLMGICCILFVGILIVLLLLGYPIIGITIAMIGATMAANAVAYFAGTKWRRL